MHASLISLIEYDIQLTSLSLSNCLLSPVYLQNRPLRLLYARSVVLTIHAQALPTNPGGGDVDTELQHSERADNDANDDKSLCSVRVLPYDPIAYRAATELPITRAAAAAAALATTSTAAYSAANESAERTVVSEEQRPPHGCLNGSQCSSYCSKGDQFESVSYSAITNLKRMLSLKSIELFAHFSFCYFPFVLWPSHFF